jgi:GNAT superfamily N-acetyltransferase
MASDIRRLGIEHYDDIIRLWADAGLPTRPRGRESRERFGREMANPGVAVFGLYERDRLVAVGIANWDGRRGWINRVAVDPDHRGRRLGGQIIRACEDFLQSCGALVMAVLVEEINYPSIACFQNEGYRCIESIRYLAKYDSPDA